VVSKKEELKDLVESSKKSEPFILLGIYQKLYKEKYKKEARVNKYREKWAMQDVIDSVGYPRAIELIEYYFVIDRPDHSLTFFLYNFDKMDRVKTEIDKDKINRQHLLEATKHMVEEGGIA
jgi:hypothetical protein